MIADVQDWLDFPDSNYGWLLAGGEDFAHHREALRLAGSDDPAARPQLLVEYEVPCAALELEGAARALCHAYCEALDCDAAAPEASPLACAQAAEQFARRSGGVALVCERSESPRR